MTVADVIQAAMALTPEERAQVADVLYGTDDLELDEVSDAWIRVSVDRFESIKRGDAKTFDRAEAEAFLDAHTSQRT